MRIDCYFMEEKRKRQERNAFSGSTLRRVILFHMRKNQRAGFLRGLCVCVDVNRAGFAVELSVLAFQHGGYRRGKLTVHALGKTFADGIKTRRDQHAKAVFRQKRQLFLFGNDIMT